MGIKKLKAAKGQREVKPPVTIHIDASTPEDPQGKEPLRFREPNPRDMSAVLEAMRRAGTLLPGLDAESSFQVGILAVCYLPDDSDGAVDAVQAFAELAADNDYAFDEVVNAFAEEYPDFFGWLRRRLVGSGPDTSKTSTSSV